MKRLLILLVFLWGGGALGWWYLHGATTRRPTFRTATVRRGNLLASIDATGTIEPEDVVDVGAQVAGLIRDFGPDPDDPDRPISYGSLVDRDTVLARLDDSLYKARQSQARAGLSKAEAELNQASAKLRQARRELDRQVRLHQKGPGITSQQETDGALANFENAEAAEAVARGAVEVAKSDLEEASVNLGYTTIRSPVRGVILDRRVNIGQTVVASLNAPSLFLIAKDLKRMVIWASVNETDIGAVHVGQGVRFSVGAFPREEFPGRVVQVRLNASMVQSVVTYTVVVDVDNSDGRLLPYLTARLRFEVEKREGVLIVPNTALRWQPRDQDIDPAVDGHARGSRPKTNANEGTLWVRRGDFVQPVTVALGLNDGTQTEVSGADLREGAEVVIGATRPVETDDVSAILPYTNTN